MWELRENVTVHDATYVALAEALDAKLLTADRRLARGIEAMASCQVLVVTAAG